ncbi:3-hydroxyacyl-CoA dehydrogenase [Salmonella enterica subsp. salamae]|nr:3-hydroxyacyl-CoA dehydrogenase [Salmonella enterica subsp. salamae]
MISAERDHIGISLIIYLHFINTKYTLRFIWYDQITLCVDSGD